MSDEYIVIEVPPQMPVTATPFADESEALAGFEKMTANSGGAFESWARSTYETDADPWDADEATQPFRFQLPSGEEQIVSFRELLWEWVAHDLHALYRYTFDEARAELARLRAPNAPNAAGQQKIHQQASVVASLARFVEGWEE